MGRTVVHLAARFNSKTVLDQLLLYPCWESGVDIDDNCGQTPLWFAAKHDCVDCIDVLLVHGANPDHKR